jgi:hypothetical protein
MITPNAADEFHKAKGNHGGILPLDMQRNILRLVLAYDARGDESAGYHAAAGAVAVLIKDTDLETNWKER